ncbi:MAG: hypothetical protein MZV70_13935 [Desulfobacterales bacterium]|nr:hypothetical protein [Desulfobacterales bacterium]
MRPFEGVFIQNLHMNGRARSSSVGFISCMKGKPTGIEGLDDLLGGHGDAGSIPAFDDNYRGDLEIAKCPLKDAQALF